MKHIKMKIKNLGMFTLVTLFFLGIIMTLPLLNVIYKISYIDMPEIVAFTLIAFVVYTLYFMSNIYTKGIKR